MSMYTASKYKNMKAGDVTNPSFEDINFKKTDCTLVAASLTLISFVIDTTGAGCYVFLPATKFGRIVRAMPKVCAHAGEIIDMVFYPFSNNILATGSADTTIRIWELPEEGLTNDMDTPLVELSGHQRKVTVIVWHPTTENILLSGGADPFCCLWNVSTGEMCCKVTTEEGTQGLSFNYNGSLATCMTRGRKLLVFDPRKNDCKSVITHDGNRAYTPIFLKDENIFTCGTTKNGDREIALWNSKNLSEPLKRMRYDGNRGQMIPYYEPEHGIIIILGKGETLGAIIEVFTEAPYITVLAQFTLANGGGLRGFNVMPKIACNVKECEIIRGLRIHSNACEVISFTIPRLSKDFQSDLFSKIRGNTSAQTDKQYFSGCNAQPNMIDLKTLQPSTIAKSKCLTINLANKTTSEGIDLETRLANIEQRLAKLEKK